MKSELIYSILQTRKIRNTVRIAIEYAKRNERLNQRAPSVFKGMDADGFACYELSFKL